MVRLSRRKQDNHSVGFIIHLSIAAVFFCAAAWAHGEPEQTRDLPQETSTQDTAQEPGPWKRFLQWRRERVSITDTYKLAVQGPAYTAIQDTRMTPLIYRAPGFRLIFENRIYRPREIVQTDLTFQFAYVLNSETLSGDYTYINPRGMAAGAYLRRIKNLPLAIGGSLSITGNYRIIGELSNSGFNYDIIASIEPMAQWEQDFTLLDRPARWHVSAAIPVFSFVIRHPSYNISLGGSDTIWAPPWRFYRLRLNAGIDRLLKHSDENRFTVDYHYDFYGLRDPDSGHRLNIGTHTITLGYALKTK